MANYRIRTIVGGGLSIYVGASVTTFEVENLRTRESAYYTFSGIDFGFGFKVGGIQGPSSWTEFSWGCGIRDFHGYVTVVSASLTVGIGAGLFDMSFVNGPAAGLAIPGVGWGSGLSASVVGSHGWMRLR